MDCIDEYGGVVVDRANACLDPVGGWILRRRGVFSQIAVPVSDPDVAKIIRKISPDALFSAFT